MIKKAFAVPEKFEEIVKLGKDGRSTLQDVADAWGCEKDNVASYLWELHKQKKYGFIIDGKGCFKLFQEII